MIKRLLLVLVALLIAPSAALGQQKPLVTVGGQTRQLPAGTTLGTQAGTTGAASLNIPQGVAPTSPSNGDVWATSSGVYARVNGATVGPMPGTGNTTTFTAGLGGSIASPSYASGAYHSYHPFILNGADPATDFFTEQAGLAATDALTVGLKVTSGTIHQTNAIAGYMESSRAKPVTNGGDVAGYFHGKASGTNANVFGVNALVSDTAGFTGQTLQHEFDVNVNAASTSVQGFGLVLNSSIAITNAPLGYVCRIASTAQWGACYYTTDGGTPIAFHAGALGTGNNVYSQPIEFVSRSSGGTAYTAKVMGDPTGGLVLRPGVAGGAVGIQDFGGATLAYVNSNGLFVGPTSSTGVTALTVQNASAASATTKTITTRFQGLDTISGVKDVASNVVTPIDVNWVDSSQTFSIRVADALAQRLTLSATGAIVGRALVLPQTTVAALPTCNAGLTGGMAAVTDATAPTYNAALTGGGAVKIPVFCNGSAWTAH